MPRATFVGVDLSARQIADGRALLGRLGLTNVELIERSLTDVGPDFGLFDFIVCHGVYSWVSAEPCREGAGRLLREPRAGGGRLRQLQHLPRLALPGQVCDMLRFHAAGFPASTDPARLVEESAG